jgi:hypothetical protein
VARAVQQAAEGSEPPGGRFNAVRVIESGQDLARWANAADQKKREQVLHKLRTQLQAAPPSPKRIAKTIKSANEWQEGEVIGFRLLSGRWVLLRVIGHHEDRGVSQLFVNS